MYRYHTLPGARAKAARIGCKGALYAWESADTGEETTPEQRGRSATAKPIDILTGTHGAAHQRRHRLCRLAVLAATGDDGFLLEAGAEILLETARFWASRAVPEADGQSAHPRT